MTTQIQSVRSTKTPLLYYMPHLFENLVLLALLAMSRRDKDVSCRRDDILQLDGIGLSGELAAGRVTAEEVMRATLDRIDRVNDHYKAIVALRDRESLLDEARQCDRKLQQIITDESKRKDTKHGRLLGIPVAIKDLSNVVGLPTTMGGSWLFRFFNYPKVSDRFAQNMVDEGAIVIGKTNAPELGVGSHTFNRRWGTTLNPYDDTKSAGGSSGGAAVALTIRILCLADGSDMMGSLRNPAGWNNCYSHRPTAGLVPERETTAPNVNPLAYPISTPGPMARTPRDLALLFDVMAGTNHFNAGSLEENPNIQGAKIAWLGDWCGEVPVEDGILPLCRKALQSFEEKGATVHDITTEPVFDIQKLWKSWTTIRSKVIAANFNFPNVLLSAFLRVAPMRQEVKWEVRRGMTISEEECNQARDIAQQWSTRLEELFEVYDFLALPTAQTWPFPAVWRWPRRIQQTEMTSYHKWMEIAVPGSLAGTPCVTIPAGFGPDGLPMGIQILGRRGDDAKLLNLAQCYHTIIDWPNQKLPTEIKFSQL